MLPQPLAGNVGFAELKCQRQNSSVKEFFSGI
jgi:hypothetical protein